GTNIKGGLKNPLNNRQALTVALPLPEGYWNNPKRHFSALSIRLYLLGLIVSLGLFILWFMKGRNRQIFPSVEFYPPEKVTSADVGYIIDGKADNIDATSLIISLAEKGFMTITEENETIEFTKKKDVDDSISPLEQYMFKKIFEDRDKVSVEDLKGEFHVVIDRICWSVIMKYSKDSAKNSKDFDGKINTGSSALNDFVNSLVKKDPDADLLKADRFSMQLFDKPPFLFILLAGIIAIVPLFMVFYAGFSSVPYGTISGLNMSSMLLGMIIFSFVTLIIIILSHIHIIPGRSKKSLPGLIVFYLAFGGAVYFTAVKQGGMPFSLYFTGSLTSLISISFVQLFNLRRTPEGVKIYEKVLGFRNFIESAEKDKIDTLFESDPSYFYNILPYALVLGLSDKWASHFSELSLQPPQWYQGRRDEAFRVDRFTRDFQDRFEKINSNISYNPAAASASSSSGSSSSSTSGGSAGGGAGGGGGRSW
ncbi:MAG: DUF2207 domain-containing protein, partial [Candidatus Cloacimonetes bacterium]|nr:DUF2207 domain-containing protein [Candidatus Cloacimonadota bacterium]